jgi:hypothetical protein
MGQPACNDANNEISKARKDALHLACPIPICIAIPIDIPIAIPTLPAA